MLGMLEQYDAFRRETVTEIKNLRVGLELGAVEASKLVARVSSAESLINMNSDDIQKAALKTECRAIAKQINDIESLLHSKASKIELIQVDDIDALLLLFFVDLFMMLSRFQFPAMSGFESRG